VNNRHHQPATGPERHWSGPSITRNLRPSEFGSSCLILLFCLVAGVVAAYATYRNSTGTTEAQLTRLTLPESAVEILGIDISSYFQADPYVQMKDGAILGRDSASGVTSWLETARPANLARGAACNNERQASIEASADPLVDCRTIRTLSEWCPGPVVSFGLGSDGQLWELSEGQPCGFALKLSLIIFVPAGLALGLVLVLLKQLGLAIMRQRHTT
jgi:hypothetical protein